MVVVQVKKNLAVLWKPAKLRHRRNISALHGSLDAPPALREGRRPWLLLIIILVFLYYMYYCRIGQNYSVLSNLEKPELQVRTEDVTVVVKQEMKSTLISITKLLCGENRCNFKAPSKPTRKKLKIKDFYKDYSDSKQPCKIYMAGRGRLQWNNTEVELTLTRSQYPTVKLGGYYSPDCQSRHKVAIIVPYRDNEKNLNVFLFNIHPFLMRQKIEYRIFVIEQIGQDDMNRGSLLNVGYEQARRFGSWQCLIFHDFNLLPLDDRILYTCPTYPRHMSASVQGQESQTKYKLFGGVAAMSDEHFLKVNGYSNTYWGCCGADTDMYWRIRLMGLRVVRYDKKIAVYKKLPSYPQEKDNLDRPRRTSPGSRKSQYRTDGLTTIQYKVLNIQQRILYTHVKVDLNPSPNYTTSRIW